MREDIVLARLRAGDRRALREVYDELGGLVYRTALAVTADEAMAEIVAAEAFVALWRRPDLVDGTIQGHLTRAVLDGCGLPRRQAAACITASMRAPA